MVVNVVLVDDHGIIRDGVRRLLEAHGDIRVVAAEADAQTGVAAALREKPNVVIMDISLKGTSGIEAMREIVRQCPDTAVLILSVHSASELVRQALSAGARGYLLKESVGDELIRALRAVAAGRRYLGAGVAEDMVDWITGEVAGALGALTPREREVLRLIAEGKSNSEAAAALDLSPRTVETYRYRMMQKLDLPDLGALIRFALREGLISGE